MLLKGFTRYDVDATGFYFTADRFYSCVLKDKQFGPKTFLGLERRGAKLLMKVSPDGVKWTTLHEEVTKLPGQLRVGVMAEGGNDGGFEAVFDKFVFTKLSK